MDKEKTKKKWSEQILFKKMSADQRLFKNFKEI